MSSGFQIERLPGRVFHWPEDLSEWGEKESSRLGLSPLQPLVAGTLSYTPRETPSPRWTKNVWKSPCVVTFESISAAAEALRSLGALWAPVSGALFRRSALIQEKLPRIPQKPRPFPSILPSAPLGAWTLVDAHTLWASPNCSSPFPGGVPLLQENKTEPPSSAYKKLQEALILYGVHPQPGDVCLDAGAAPGGWSWVLLELGARVFSVDRAKLDSRLLAHPRLTAKKQDAFGTLPSDFDKLDWLFCDVICYPAKLWDWIALWLESGKVGRFVVTLKMQGEPDWETADRFAAVPGSRLVHLHHNKHELTWML